MKYYEQDFTEYITSYNNHSVKNHILYDTIENIILYGPSGCGKYSTMLFYLSKFSLSNLKYEKKITLHTTKEDEYFIRISDIHYEIDIEQLGCNSKILWHDIYTHILNIIIQQKKKQVIVCKNYHKIDNDLLNVFYSYIQDSRKYGIKMILITESLSFIPNNMLKSFNIIRCSKIKNINTFHKPIDVKLIENLKEYKLGFPLKPMAYKKTNELIRYMDNYPDISYTIIRELIYDILIYDIDIYDVCWLIISSMINTKQIKNPTSILLYTYSFLQLYNNNYRPIFHLENFVYNLLLEINGDRKSM